MTSSKEREFLLGFLHFTAIMSTSYDPTSIRTATVSRNTSETSIECTITLDHQPGVKQEISVSTGIGFLDHVSPLSLSLVLPRANREWKERIDVDCLGETWTNEFDSQV